jgi:hypothetical protein
LWLERALAAIGWEASASKPIRRPPLLVLREDLLKVLRFSEQDFVLSSTGGKRHTYRHLSRRGDRDGNAALNSALKRKSAVDQLALADVSPFPVSPAEFQNFVAGQSSSWSTILSKANLKAQ